MTMIREQIKNLPKSLSIPAQSQVPKQTQILMII